MGPVPHRCFIPASISYPTIISSFFFEILLHLRHLPLLLGRQFWVGYWKEKKKVRPLRRHWKIINEIHNTVRAKSPAYDETKKPQTSLFVLGTLLKINSWAGLILTSMFDNCTETWSKQEPIAQGVLNLLCICWWHPVRIFCGSLRKKKYDAGETDATPTDLPPYIHTYIHTVRHQAVGQADRQTPGSQAGGQARVTGAEKQTN